MLPRTVEVVAASRLHFGLVSFGNESVRQFGGVGVMVEKPAIHIRISAAAKFHVEGPAANRVESIVHTWVKWRTTSLPECQIAVLSLPRLHTGLGVGTQLSLSVAAALDAFSGLPATPVHVSAVAMARGQRSAVGTYGFAQGGLIAECGKYGEDLSPLDQRLALPDEWRFVMICPRNRHGLHGQNESEVFRNLPAVPPDASRELIRELHDHMLPAVAAARFDEFSESVYHFGYRAGLCYATVQGGPYNGPRAAELVRAIRDCGVVGAGQSSWGPTVFAICRDAVHAESLTSELARRQFLTDTDTTISAPCNVSARVMPTAPYREAT